MFLSFFLFTAFADEEIVNGEPAELGDFPEVTAVRLPGSICTGSLIAPGTVLAGERAGAAFEHCVRRPAYVHARGERGHRHGFARARMRHEPRVHGPVRGSAGAGAPPKREDAVEPCRTAG